MRKKAILISLLLFSSILLLGGCNQSKASTLTTSKMTKAININELSTSEFVYNGIAQVLDNTGDKTKYSVLYNATVKMGIRMDWVVFDLALVKRTTR